MSPDHGRLITHEFRPMPSSFVGKHYAFAGDQPSAVQASGHARSSSFRLFLRMRFTYSSLGSIDAPGKRLRGPSGCSGRNPLCILNTPTPCDTGPSPVTKPTAFYSATRMFDVL